MDTSFEMWCCGRALLLDCGAPLALVYGLSCWLVTIASSALRRISSGTVATVYGPVNKAPVGFRGARFALGGALIPSNLGRTFF